MIKNSVSEKCLQLTRVVNKSKICLDWSVESPISPSVWLVIPRVDFARRRSTRQRNIRSKFGTFTGTKNLIIT